MTRITKDNFDAYLRQIADRGEKLEQSLRATGDYHFGFCEDCPRYSAYNDSEEYWGAPAAICTVECPADFDGDDPDCYRHDEYLATREQIDALDSEFNRIEALYPNFSEDPHFAVEARFAFKELCR